MNVRWSGLLSPRKVVGAVTDELAFDLLRVDAARVAIKAVQTEIAKTLPADLGVILGFNSLDGD